MSETMEFGGFRYRRADGGWEYLMHSASDFSVPVTSVPLAAACDALAAARAQLAEAQADLAAVRKVEEWNGGLTGRHIVQCADGRFVAAHYPAQQTAGAERIAAGPLDLVSLGRALAAQEGTDAT